MKKKKKEKQELNLKKEYKKSWDYLKKTKNYFLVIVSIFIIASLIGFFVPAPEFVSQGIMKIIQDLIEKTQGMNQLELITFILTNNVQTSFLGMILGFVLGIFPILTTIINGYLLGFVSSMTVNAESTLSLLKLLPHGIFELPAVFIALGLGLKLGNKVIEEKFRIKKKYLRITIIASSTIIILILAALLYKTSVALLGGILFLIILFTFILIFSNKILRLEFIESIRIFILIILPLLLIAGIIEGSLIFLIN